jgi:predicted enzyme related to lactoylglutathione lyase
MFLGLRTVVYHVSNLEEAKRWYSKVSGVEPYFDEPFYVGFNVGGFELGLDPAPQAESPGSAGAVAYWGVENCHAAFEALLAAGAKAEQEPQEVGGGIIHAFVRDPWGNVLGVIENPHFKREDVR